ncbi:hypothetical protein P154DRAFT_520627 [Amniculicola lignicola CBS 123094]|uniref:Uncharacterized protein n=1 Tax=Amniculicola lignicola CBS 123094 TaxID=1392246 RepID=A0A6A5WLM1_9PLEO|nr:hypothetical protein P154DRAFT_520627 [Amniculicola lignicola CBS 123094]
MYRVDYRRLQRRVKGVPSQSARPPTNQRLDPTQLAALELYIKRLNNISMPPLIFIWRAAAEQIRQATTPPGTILLPLGRDFFKRYIAMNSNKIRKIKQKSKDIERVVSQERDIVKDFFTKYREAIEKLSIQ